MGATITHDLFQHHNAFSFDPEKKAELREKHGLVPYWANVKYREERRGYGSGLAPIKVDDDYFMDVVNTLRNVPADPTSHTHLDGKFHQGDCVLAVQPVENWQAVQDRRTYLANRRLRQLSQNPVGRELAREQHTEHIEVPPARFRHIRGEEERPMRGMTKPQQAKAPQAIKSGNWDAEKGRKGSK